MSKEVLKILGEKKSESNFITVECLLAFDKDEDKERVLSTIRKFSSKLCHRCGYKNEDLVLHDRTWCCPVCGETHDRDVNASINLYFVGLGRPEVKPVERALVDDRSPYGLPKKPSRVEAGSSTTKD